jgi:hypothetical protein
MQVKFMSECNAKIKYCFLPTQTAGIKKTQNSWHWCLTPVILATQEAEIRRIVV